ncbi:hypothetical protein VB714_24990 [Spirulina sp. 06S082]|nr:hypothetical protein [Spirulina sp. 06S082]
MDYNQMFWLQITQKKGFKKCVRLQGAGVVTINIQLRLVFLIGLKAAEREGSDFLGSVLKTSKKGQGN